MDQLHKQVARARRRLMTEQILGRLVWCQFAALIIAVVAIAIPKLLVIENIPAGWAASWLIGCVGAGLLVAVGWTLVSSRSSLDAAIEIDRRYQLRERVASSLSLSPQEQTSQAGKALIRDALRAVDRIDVAERFHVRVHRRAWLPLVPAVIAFCLMAFVGNREAASDSDSTVASATAQQVQKSAEALRKKIAERRQQAEKEGLKAAEGLFQEIEKSTTELTAKKEIDRTQAVVKLNDLAKQLQDRRRQLGGKEELQRQFNNMKNMGQGPADKVAQAMKQGNWKKAMEAVQELEKKLQQGALNQQQKQQLAEQLQRMKEEMEAVSEARQQAMKDLQQQIEAERRKGNLAKAGELQDKLAQLQQQQQQIDRMQQMAEQLAQAQQAIQQGNPQQAGAALSEMAQQLAQMQKDADEMEMLDAAMSQLEMAKNSMGCQQCGGEGCQACQGGMGMGMGFGDNLGMNPGLGMGRGTGQGPRPDEENATNTRNTRVRQKPGRGAAVFGGMVEGPNIRGQVAEAIKEEMNTLATEPADPLTNERLPRSRREHAEEYFRLLREGI